MTNDYITVMSHTYDANGSPPTGGRITAQKDASTGAITGYTVHHHITDHLGSVRAVVDFAGNILETSDFLPYGTRWSQTGGSAAGKLSLDAALTTGGRINAQKDASTRAITET